MIFLKALFIVVEVICCLMLAGLVLLQRSKSEGLGLAFGASTGESLFGARAGNVLSKATVILGITFIVSTLILGMLFVQKDKPLMEAYSDGSDQTEMIQQPATDILDIDGSSVVPMEETDGGLVDESGETM